MATLNIPKIKEEILMLLRNGDIFTPAERGALTTTDNFIANSSQTDFTLINDAILNIRSVTVDSNPLNYITEYDINIVGKSAIESKVIELVTGLTGGESVDIEYDYIDTSSINSEKVYPDHPQDFVTMSAFPRVGFELDSISNKNRSANDTLQQKNMVFSFFIGATNDKVEIYSQTVYNLIFTHRKSFKRLTVFRPDGETGRTPNGFFKAPLIYSKYFIYKAPAQFER